MRALVSKTVPVAIALLTLSTASAAAQEATLGGRVTDSRSGAPISGARLEFLGAEPRTIVSDGSGMYRVRLREGTYDLVVAEIAHRSARLENVRVSGPDARTIDIQLSPRAIVLPEITVVSRTPQRLSDAPALAHVVTAERIAEQPTINVAEHLEDAPGIDMITKGLQGREVVAQGFNNIFSGGLYMLTDHRLAKMPSLSVNIAHFLPATDLDIDRMEVALGPGSALYGPQTANLVVDIITKSPLDSQGTTMLFGGGERSVLQGALRTAFLVGDDLGFKLSGQYFQGEEWEHIDPTEQAAREWTDTHMDRCVADRMIRGIDEAVAALACERLGTRNFDLERWSVEGRADWRFAPDGTLIATYGRTDATGLELTGLGAAQAQNWIYEFYQARLEKGRFFAQTYYNTNDAGGSYLLTDGTPLVDESTLFVAQVRHGRSLFDGREDLVYGADYFATRPSSMGTIYGQYDIDDDLNEWGPYLQSRTEVTPQMDLILAGRLDSSSGLGHKVWSPRTAVVYRPSEGQTFRFSYNRAYSSPTSLNLFLDLSNGFAPDDLGSLGYTARAFGTGRNGYVFQNPDGSLRGVRSPFNPNGAGELLAADASALWPLAVGALREQGAIDQDTAALLASLSPTGDDIALMLFDPETTEVTPASAATIPDVTPLVESPTERFEIGWTGELGNRVTVSGATYYMKRHDFVSPLILQTPLVLLSGADVGAFIAGPVGTAIATKLVEQGMDPETAQATAAAQVAQLAEGIGSLPVAVVSSDAVDAQSADLILAFRNVGDVELWGADVAVQARLGEEWTMTGTYSYISEDYFQLAGGEAVALNAPKNKGSIGLAYRNVSRGLNAATRVRFTSSFPAQSAGFVGTRCVTGDTGGIFDEDCVASAPSSTSPSGTRCPTHGPPYRSQSTTCSTRAIGRSWASPSSVGSRPCV